MAWVALDRAVKDAEAFDLEGPLDEWREVRARIHAAVCEQGYSQHKQAFCTELWSRKISTPAC